MSSAPNHRRPAVKVFVATTVLLSFISFWRAAAIVLSDLGSSAYYVGGDAEKVIGKSAPWFILAVMLFANCVRALYIESTSMFVRGGVYRVVRRAMGGTLAKFSVSALMFDYILTGPISGVSAGLYLTGLLNGLLQRAHWHFSIPQNAGAAVFAVMVTIYFWWKNTPSVSIGSCRQWPEIGSRTANRNAGRGSRSSSSILRFPWRAMNREPGSAWRRLRLGRTSPKEL